MKRTLREEAILRERAFLEAVDVLKDLCVTTEDLSDDEDRELERLIRTEVTDKLRAQLVRLWARKDRRRAIARPRKRSRK